MIEFRIDSTVGRESPTVTDSTSPLAVPMENGSPVRSSIGVKRHAGMPRAGGLRSAQI
jgi:hypothetical protein